MDLREKLLLRQIEVLNRAPDIKFNEINFKVESEEKVLEELRNYGVYQNIECFLPYLENENENENLDISFEKSFFDPIDNKKLSESIINLTLKESQNLIKRSADVVTSVSDKLKVEQKWTDIDKSLDLHGNAKLKLINQKNDVKVKEQPEVSRLKRNDSSSNKKTLKNISNLTLNNCGSGNIVLKNISNLTINTCKQPKMLSKTDDPPEPTKMCTTSKSCDGSFYQCDFYDRLISENEVLKRSVVNQSWCTTYPDPTATCKTTCMSPTALKALGKKDGACDDGTYSIASESGDTTTTSSVMDETEDGLPSKCSKISFDPTIEEILTRTMLAENLLNHPPMIQCWLNKMLLETETESQNLTEFLEISNII